MTQPTPLSDACPICHYCDLLLLPNGHLCGCSHCQSVFTYPAMVEVQILPKETEQE